MQTALKSSCGDGQCDCLDRYEVDAEENDPATADPWPDAEIDTDDATPTLAAATKIHGVVIGRLAGALDNGHVAVDYPGNPTGVPIVATVAGSLGDGQQGVHVALMFEASDPLRPIVLGPIVTPVGQPATDPSPSGSSSQTMPPTPPPARPAPRSTASPVNVQADDDELTLTADRQITLRCGKASITLTRAGKVLIRGAYLLNRSSGVNKIKGGSVQIN